MAHPPPSDPPATLPPPAPHVGPPPFDWEDRVVFRETFLYHLTPPGVADAFRRLGVFFYDLVLQHSEDWPAWLETPTRTELRAAAVDLRFLQGFLQSSWKSSEVGEVAKADLPLCRKAFTWSRRVAQIALEIEKELGPEPAKGEAS